eukprot:333954_1
MNFKDEVAVVTGAGRGLGREYALKLATLGCKVVVNNRTPEKADEVVAEIRQKGGIAIANYANVATAGEKAVEAAINKFGKIDILISNAGQLRDKSLKNMTLEMFTDVINTHVIGTFRVIKAAWTYMYKQKYGRIVIIGSQAAFWGGFGQANYAAAKGALVGLNGICAVEGFKKNILSNLICTEGITRMNENLMRKDDPRRELWKPKYCANAVLVLCHKDCPTTGKMYQTEGGTIRQFRVQASDGMKYDPKTKGIDHVVSRWNETGDFTKHSFPAELRHSKIKSKM